MIYNNKVSIAYEKSEHQNSTETNHEFLNFYLMLLKKLKIHCDKDNCTIRKEFRCMVNSQDIYVVV